MCNRETDQVQCDVTYSNVTIPACYVCLNARTDVDDERGIGLEWGQSRHHCWRSSCTRKAQYALANCMTHWTSTLTHYFKITLFTAIGWLAGCGTLPLRLVVYPNSKKGTTILLAANLIQATTHSLRVKAEDYIDDGMLCCGVAYILKDHTML